MARDYYTLAPDRMYRIGQHFTPGRAGAKIEFITRHHLMSISQGEYVVDKIWNTRQASAHHIIGPDGRWVQAVYDRDTAWANANQWANQRTIAIEHANSTGRAPGATDFNDASWNISDATIINGARVAAAYCLYFGLGRPVYGKNIRDHFEFTSTGCPVHLQGPHPKNSWGGRAGKYHEKWMQEAQHFYDLLKARQVNPDGTLKAGSTSGRALPAKPAPAEKLLDYPRDQVKQDTFYNCGPASVQTVVRAATGNLVSEAELGRQLRTTRNGTDYIGQFPAVLNRHIPGARYAHRDMPTDPPTPEQKERLWRDLTGSINAGHGVVANIVAPPSNYPRAVWPSTQNLAYSGGTVYHYVAVMGYAGEGAGRRVWLADSGFAPYGCWISFDQLSTLVPPKGYAYSTTPSRKAGFLMALSDQEQKDLQKKINDIHHELTERFQSRYVGPDGQRSTFRDTLVGYVLEADRKLEDMHRNNLPAIWNAVKSLIARKGK